MNTRSTLGGGTLLGLALLFIGLTILFNHALRGWRLDLTQNRLYTTAAGTDRILASIKEPINLYLFFSAKTAAQLPQLKTYGVRVREFLEELAARSGGRLRLHVIDPQPFSEEEDRASELGVRGTAVGATGTQFYFGLAGTNSTDGHGAIRRRPVRAPRRTHPGVRRPARPARSVGRRGGQSDGGHGRGQVIAPHRTAWRRGRAVQPRRGGRRPCPRLVGDHAPGRAAGRAPGCARARQGQLHGLRRDHRRTVERQPGHRRLPGARQGREGAFRAAGAVEHRRASTAGRTLPHPVRSADAALRLH